MPRQYMVVFAESQGRNGPGFLASGWRVLEVLCGWVQACTVSFRCIQKLFYRIGDTHLIPGKRGKQAYFLHIFLSRQMTAPELWLAAVSSELPQDYQAPAQLRKTQYWIDGIDHGPGAIDYFELLATDFLRRRSSRMSGKDVEHSDLGRKKIWRGFHCQYRVFFWNRSQETVQSLAVFCHVTILYPVPIVLDLWGCYGLQGLHLDIHGKI